LFFAIFEFFSKILSNRWVKNWVATGGTCHPTALSIFPKAYRSDSIWHNGSPHQYPGEPRRKTNRGSGFGNEG